MITPRLDQPIGAQLEAWSSSEANECEIAPIVVGLIVLALGAGAGVAAGETMKSGWKKKEQEAANRAREEAMAAAAAKWGAPADEPWGSGPKPLHLRTPLAELEEDYDLIPGIDDTAVLVGGGLLLVALVVAIK